MGAGGEEGCLFSFSPHIYNVVRFQVARRLHPSYRAKQKITEEKQTKQIIYLKHTGRTFSYQLNFGLCMNNITLDCLKEYQIHITLQSYRKIFT